MTTDAEFVEHLPCDTCGSSDANALYDDGHSHCFSCGKTVQTGRSQSPSSERSRTLRDLESPGEYRDLPGRGLREDTLKKYGYTVRDGMQIAPYHDDAGALIAQKIRRKGKEFNTTGDFKSVTLFGQRLFKSGGKRLTIVEGEIDAMSVFQMNGGWPAVSVPTGAKGAAKAIRANIEWIESYDEVIFAFDMDEPGEKAARECAEILTPGKAKIAKLPEKDANECLKSGLQKEFRTALWEAATVRPDGIVSLADTWEAVSKPVEMGIPYPWPQLNEKTYGMRLGEIVTLTAGSGVGKSAVSAEVAYSLVMDAKHTVGYVALEEGVAKTAKRFMGMYLNKPIHLPGIDVTPEDLRAAFDATCGTGRFYSYDHFGSLDGDNLLSKLRYLVKGCGCQWIILDHISIVVSGMDADGDERRAIDKLMTDLRSFVEETGIGMILVSHLKRPPGTAHEEGGKTSLAQLRGSAAIAQLSDLVIGCERNQQSEDEIERNVTLLRLLKNRYSGDTGEACELLFDKKTGRLTQHASGGDEDPFDIDEIPF